MLYISDLISHEYPKLATEIKNRNKNDSSYLFIFALFLNKGWVLFISLGRSEC